MKMSETIKNWIALGGECLNLWMESGVEYPSDYGKKMMKQWIDQCFDSGWSEITDIGNSLLSDEVDTSKKANSLLRLCMWYESLCLHTEIFQLEEFY